LIDWGLMAVSAK